MAKSRYKIVEKHAPHFLTMTIVNWIPLFAAPSLAGILLESLRFLQEQERLMVYAYVILENHLHLIAQGANLAKDIASFKSYTAGAMIDHLQLHQAERVLKQLEQHKLLYKRDRTYQVWQEGSHPEAIQGLAMMRQKVEYIHNNPVKRGYVDEPIHWRYSSARNYAGMVGLLSVKRAW